MAQHSVDDKQRRVLLVEDNPGDARLIQEYLGEASRTQFDLVWVDRLSAGLERVAQGQVDVVLLDLSLPDSHGLDTLARLRAEAPGMPIVVLTSLDDEEVGARAVGQGAQDYLIKGQVDAVVLSRSVRYAIERMQTEQVLFTLARQNELILSSAGDGIFGLDREAKVSFMNPAAARMLGREVTKVVGQPFCSTCRHAKLDGNAYPIEECAIHRTDNDGVARSADGELFWREDGTSFPVDFVSTSIREGDELLGAVVVFRDITERKREEDALRELVRMKDDFVASVSHELRTPLGSIKGFVSLLLGGKVADPVVRREFLTRLGQDADRLAALVNSLLEVSRLEANGLPLELEQVDINALIAETLQSLRGVADNKAIALQHVSPRTPLTVGADRRQVQQVLLNMIGNAIKYSEPHRRVLLTAQKDSGDVRVDVVDQGPGIPAEDLPRLFGKFYRGHDSGTRATAGTGLGLYIAAKIIEAHGGQTGVKTELGKGSTFYFTLPLSAKRRPATIQQAQSAKQRSRDGILR